MTDWTSGYVADVDYSYGYYPELNPLRARMVFLNAGLAPPQPAVACELGFGQGVSINVHSAASNTAWWGTDFNPSHATGARRMATASGAQAQLFDEAFADFCQRSDLPDFDSIGLHGVWSWISDENRAVMVDFFRRKLKPGGYVYVSYNSLPGHAPTIPLRHLLVRHAEVMSAPGSGLVPRIDAALGFAQQLLAQNPAFAVAFPNVGARLERMIGEDRHYLAHEYFNRDWSPMHFDEMAQLLGSAKLTFAGSAHYLDHIDLLNFSEEQRGFLNGISDPTFRETVRDFMISQQFRRDYFVKGPQRLPRLDRFEATLAERFVLTTNRDKIAFTANGSAGEKTLREDVYLPILDALASHEPKSFADLLTACGGRGGDGFTQLFEALIVLIGKGDVVPAQADAVVSASRQGAGGLNRAIMALARSDQTITVLASPVTGGGVAVGRFQQLFLLARSQGARSPNEYGAYAWKCLADQGQRVLADGKALESPEENLAELTRQAVAFETEQLPMLKATLIAT